MQNSDAEIQKAKHSISPLFVDKYNRPKRSPFYVTQLQTLLETEHFPWIVYQAASQLVEEDVLDKYETPTRYHRRVVFFFNKKLATPEYKPILGTHIKSICGLIDKYSKPSIGKALGDHLEGLVKAELRAQVFNIVGTHTP